MHSKMQYPEMVATLQNQEFLINFTNLLGHGGAYKKEISSAISILGKFVHAGRVYVFESEGTGKVMRNTFEWTCLGIEPLQKSYPCIHLKMPIAFIRDQLLKDGQFIAQPGNDSKAVDELLKSRQALTIILLPFHIRNNLGGFIGIDSCSSIRHWNDMEIGFLKTIAATLGAAMERHKSEMDMAGSEKKFQNLFNLSSDAILIFNHLGHILEVNKTACVMLGTTKDALLSRTVDSVMVSGLEIYRMPLFMPPSQSLTYEKEFIHSSGDTFPVEISSSSVIYSNQPAVMWVVRNISERKQLERQLLTTIIQTEEQERGRLARDLHDGLGPLLSSLKLYTKVVENNPDDQRRKEMLGCINEVIDESVLLIKEISNNLNPQVLEDFGLASAIQAFCKKITIAQSIDIRFDSNVFDVRFENNTEVILFRILKELVNNTIKHALATQIEVFLIRTDQLLTLMYSDNGIGFDFQKMLNNNLSGMGIANIVNRIHSVKGKLSIEKNTEKGFSIKLEVDLK